jgi:uncharacterized damage-inducible protein DinB
MATTRSRPDRNADELDLLLGWYQLQRGIVLLKCEDLSEDDAHRSVIPTSPLMTVAGIVGHLRWAEERWFREVLLGEPGTGRGYGTDEDDPEFKVAGISLSTLIEEYVAESDRSDATIRRLGLDATGSDAVHPTGDVTVRWMVLHMLEETARHAGHLDLIRELLDGSKGYY